MICASCGYTLSSDTSTCINCSAEAYLAGRYRLDEIVGRGATGTTYRATRLEDDAVFAVKELPFHRIESFKTQSLFEREAAVLEQLDHHGIPQYVDHFTFGEGKHLTFCLIQEFIEGETLEEEMKRRRFDEREALEILDELLEVIEYLHDRVPPVIHRDLKPKNVMRRASDGRLVVIDFGSVRDVIKDPEEGGSTIAGTFGFMAPEQFQGIATPATDVYGLGALTVAMMARKEPHKMLDYTNRLRWEKHVDVHPATGELLRSMLEPDFRERPSSAGALKRELDEVFDALDGKTTLPARRPATVPSKYASESGEDSYADGGVLDGKSSEVGTTKSVGWSVIPIGFAFVFALGVFFFLISDSGSGSLSTTSYTSTPDPRSTVTKRAVGGLAQFELGMPEEEVASMGSPVETPETEGQSYRVPLVVMRQGAECTVRVRDARAIFASCPVEFSGRDRGPTSLPGSVEYFNTKYGRSSTAHDAETRRWIWRGPGAHMILAVPRDGNERGTLTVGNEELKTEKPKEGGRNPFYP